MNKSLLLISTFLILLITSCKKNTLEEVQAVSQSIQLSFTPDNADLGLSLANTEVTLTNKTSGIIIKAKADKNGIVNFSSITPGNYSAVASMLITAADYTKTTGVFSAEDVSFSGSLEASIVPGNAILSLSLKSGRLGNWVIKQIYYGGSSNTSGAIFRDQFIEVYNNSNEILYADSLYFAQVHGKNTKVSSVDVTKPAFLPNGQFNWANAIGMKSANPNTDFVYIKSLYMIPGTGKQYPVKPGESIIIAQNAQNHKAPYIGSDGVAVSVKDPSVTIDLSKADFETYHGNLPGINPLSSDVDNPLVPNVKVLIASGRDMILNNNGYEGIVIFKTTADLLKWATYPDPESTSITATTTQYTQVSASVVIDGVDIASTVASSRGAKRIPDAIDAGFTFAPGGSYSSQSVIRKTGKTLSSRRVLKDTNNSTEDFDYLIIADPTKTVFK